MARLARTIEKHLRGIINAIVKSISDVRVEGFNARTQRIKRLPTGEVSALPSCSTVAG